MPRDFETEVGGVTGNPPFLQAGVKPFFNLVGDFCLQVPRLGPGFQQVFKIGQFEEQVFGFLLDGVVPEIADTAFFNSVRVRRWPRRPRSCHRTGQPHRTGGIRP